MIERDCIKSLFPGRVGGVVARSESICEHERFESVSAWGLIPLDGRVTITDVPLTLFRNFRTVSGFKTDVTMLPPEG